MTTPKVSKPLRPIFENAGFQNIASAIRQSTVTPQTAKSLGKRPRYEIRYGLNQELARKARYPEEFLTALSEFLHKYNAENAQVAERSKKIGGGGDARYFRRNIQTEDIEQIAALIDEYGAPLIANMLIAYGYARVGKADAASSPETEAPAETDDFDAQSDESAE